MTGPAAPPDPNFDPALANSAINQLTSASLSGYGQLPNPQAIVEGIRTGSTATLSSALQEGNPLFQSLLAGSPAGGTSAYGSPYGRPPAAVADPTDNIWKFDASQHQQQLHDLLGKDENASWRSFGDAPMLNLGWMQSVRTGSADSTKKWQQLFKDKGWFLDPGAQVSGVWDPATEAAFQGFMVSLATPAALFATDPQQKANASMFLNGMGFDVSTLNARDPSRLAQVAQQWMAAQGPDVGRDQKHELQKYADQFGDSALPQSYQAIIQQGFFQTLADGFASIPLVGDIPGIGGLIHGAENLITMNPDWGHLSEDPRALHSQAIQQQMKDLDKLSPTDMANLAPALQQVKDDAGFLGFMDDYDHGRTKFLLASIYSLGDLVTGKFDGHRDNPFDAMSGVNLTAQAHQDNLFAGLFGDQAAQDNPAWAGLFNFAANVVDDPTSYIPLLGQVEAVQKVRGIRTVGRAIGNDAARRAFANVVGATVKMRVNDGFFKAGRAFAAGNTHYGLADVAQLAGLSGAGTEHELNQLRVLQRAFDPATEESAARDLFLNGDPATGVPGYGYLINSGKSIYNAHAAWRSLAQVKSTRILGKARVVGAFEEQAFHRAGTNPVGTGQFFRNAALAVGMEPAEIRPVLDEYMNAAMHDPDKVLTAAHKVQDAIVDGYFAKNGIDKVAFEAFVERHRAGRSFTKQAPRSADETVYYGEGQGVVRAADPDVARAQQAQVKRLNEQLTHAQNYDANPEQIAALQDQLNVLQRPAPMLTTQLADNYHFPYSLYEMIAFKNPALRASEKVQAVIHADAVLNTWKRITIGRVSSALRIDLGDDAIRPFTQLIGSGHFVAAFSYLTNAMLRAFGLLIPGTRKRVLADTMEMIEKNPDAQRVLQTGAKFFQEDDPSMWRATAPDQVGYADGLERLLRNHFNTDPLAQAWLGAYAKNSSTARNAVADVVRTSEDPRVQAWKQARKLDLSEQAFNDGIDTFHNFMEPYMRNSTLREMATTGKINQQKLRKMVKEQASLDGALPIIPSPADTPLARSMLQRVVTKFPDMIFEHVTAPMINQARVRGFIKMQAFFEAQLRNYYRDHPGRAGDEFEQMVHRESASRAVDWMTNNTYQGTRSVMGGTVRNIFPFYGATVNMDRFYMRQAAATPFVGSLIAHAALKSQQTQNAANQASPGMTGFEGVLAHLGFGGGEGVQFNPMHAFFLTSDGIGSMVPGTGPLFTPLWSAVSGNHGLAQLLADVIPGAQTQIDYNTGQAKPLFPWLADLISGTSLALTGGAPSLGPLGVSQESIDRQTDSKVAQRERETGKPVAREELDSIRREVGRDLMLQGGLSFTVPASPQVKDVQGARTAANLDQWRQQTTESGKDAVIAQALGIPPEEWTAAISGAQGAPTVSELISAKPDNDAALMAYMDHRVSPEERDAIAGVSPWVVSQATSKYQSTAAVPGEPTAVVDLAQWQVMRKMGDITLLTPEQYTAKIADERDINVGWQKYDSYKNYEYETLVQNGWTTTSPAFKAWKAAVFDPLVIRELQGPHPAWWKQFGSAAGGGKTSIDLAGKTRSLRTLQTWEVIPQHSDYENTQSVLWRNALLLRDQAAQQIYSIRAAHGSRAETDMVMMALQQQLQALATQDPNFAAQLGTFRFGNWMDVVDLEANELATAQYTGPRLQ